MNLSRFVKQLVSKQWRRPVTTKTTTTTTTSIKPIVQKRPTYQQQQQRNQNNYWNHRSSTSSSSSFSSQFSRFRSSPTTHVLFAALSTGIYLQPDVALLSASEFVLFGMKWHAAGPVQEFEDGVTVVEYSLAGETNENWTYTLSAHFNPSIGARAGVDLPKIIQDTIEAIQLEVQNRGGWFRVVNVSPLEYSIEFFMPDPDGDEQNFHRHVFTADGLHSFVLSSHKQIDADTSDKYFAELRLLPIRPVQQQQKKNP